MRALLHCLSHHYTSRTSLQLSIAEAIELKCHHIHGPSPLICSRTMNLRGAFWLLSEMGVLDVCIYLLFGSLHKHQ
jgi:hypothetical protein